MKDNLRIAMMKAVPEKWELEKNFGVFLDLLERVRNRKVDLFMTPECWLDGYASPDKDSTPERLLSVSQHLKDSTWLRRVAREAKEKGTWICFGFVQRDDSGRIYNASALYDEHGQYVGVYHKTHLQTHDLQFSFGESLPVFESPWGPLGIMICADRRWPETARTLRLKGARCILNPSYGMHHLDNEWWMRTRSYENQCFIPFAHPEVALITGPRGQIVAKLENSDPDVLVCDLNLEEAKSNNHLADRRPELYSIITETVLKK